VNAFDGAAGVFAQVFDEMVEAYNKHGFIGAEFPDGESNSISRMFEKQAKEATDQAAKAGKLTWRHILDEEVQEAFAADNWPDKRKELIQVAAMAITWILSRDRDAVKT